MILLMITYGQKTLLHYDASYPMFRWHVDIKASILSSQIPGVGNVTDVNVVSRGLGGIASEVEVKGDGRKTTRSKARAR